MAEKEKEEEDYGGLEKKSWFKRVRFWIGVGSTIGGLAFGFSTAKRPEHKPPGRTPATEENLFEDGDFSSEGLYQKLQAVKKELRVRLMELELLKNELVAAKQEVISLRNTVEGNRKEAREDNLKLSHQLDSISETQAEILRLLLKRKGEVATIQLVDPQKAVNN